jgi:aspartate ammonia-lyase
VPDNAYYGVQTLRGFENFQITGHKMNDTFVRNIVKILNFVQEADVDDEIPPTSLVREFIGGNSFYRK